MFARTLDWVKGARHHERLAMLKGIHVLDLSRVIADTAGNARRLGADVINSSVPAEAVTSARSNRPDERHAAVNRTSAGSPWICRSPRAPGLRSTSLAAPTS
jgi:hypothetical protein